MPLEPHERLWLDPGPDQSAPGAPRLLVVYPTAGMDPTDSPVMRFAGRVEPADAVVTLNGQPVSLYPGGVFTGTRILSTTADDAWTFAATAGGKSTAVTRTIRRLARMAPAPPWPLAFFASPVTPSGVNWLLPKETLQITLFASPGHHVQLRVGKSGSWRDMTAGATDPDRGGAYHYLLAAPKPQADPTPQTVYFRLTGKLGGQPQTIELASRLRIVTLPAGKQLWGKVDATLATFLKSGSGGDFDRWGNWIRGTPFPVLGGNGGRLRTGFGRGESGWVESAAVTLDEDYQKHSLPELAKPSIALRGNTLNLDWPSLKSPLACVFYPEPANGGGATLRVSLPGAASLKKFSTDLPSLGQPYAAAGFVSLAAADPKSPGAPTLTLRTTRPLWGYGFACDPAHGLRLFVRTRPTAGAPGRPLAGLRVMLDAGHGGPSLGERGPSGLLEKDINLVQAAWLQRDLEALGAQVRQVRTADVDVDLDERVDLALAWDPDLFISLHHNSVPYEADPLTDSGPIVFYHYPHSQPLAKAVAESMALNLQTGKPPRVRPSVFRVNRNVMGCPSILVESAYICNPLDEFKLRQTATLQASAHAIAAGVQALFAQ